MISMDPTKKKKIHTGSSWIPWQENHAESMILPIFEVHYKIKKKHASKEFTPAID